jgi:tetratricopeptide (TPR) repeat protein
MEREPGTVEVSACGADRFTIRTRDRTGLPPGSGRTLHPTNLAERVHIIRRMACPRGHPRSAEGTARSALWLLAALVVFIVLVRVAPAVVGLALVVVTLLVLAEGASWLLNRRPLYATRWLVRHVKHSPLNGFRDYREKRSEAEAYDALERWNDKLETLAHNEDWEGLIAATQGARNIGDEQLSHLLLRARAFAALGKAGPALHVYGECLEATQRDRDLLVRARYERGRLQLEVGRRAAARKDLSRVYAQDPTYEGVASLMEQLEGAAASGPHREPIPLEVQQRVWQRDQGCCVRCGSQDRLEYDHIIPLARGGSNTERNLQLLCESCNRAKGATI